MLKVPHFRPSFRKAVVPPDGVYLVSESDAYVLKGRRNCDIAVLVDGVHSADDIVDALADQYAPEEIYFALDLMQQKGYVNEAEPDLPRPVAALWDALGATGTGAHRRLDAARVDVLAVGHVDPGPLVKSLTEVGLAASPASRLQACEGSDLLLVVTDDYLQPQLAEVNRWALAGARRWFVAKPTGVVAWFGPLFEPGSTGCWQCLSHRLSRNREVETFLLRSLEREEPLVVSFASTPATLSLAHGWIAVELAFVLARDAGARQGDPARGGMTTLDLRSMETQKHVLVRRPQCPACGEVPVVERLPQPPTLRSGRKHYVADGGHRVATPEATIRRWEHQVSPITGTVSYLARVDVVDDAVGDVVHTYVAGHNFAMDTRDLHSLRKGLRSKSAGKGASDAQAKASALCEAIERYSGLFTGDEPRRRDSLQGLGDAAIHPNTCMLYSDRQYAGRDEWNARDSFFHVIPEPFDPDAEMDWSPLWSYTEERYKYLPTSYLYFAYPRPKEGFFCAGDSNGNAAGNTFEEAVLQGFMELAERDSVALWWYNRLRRPGLDLDSFDIPYIRDMQRCYRDQFCRDVWVLDLTSDLGIPAFAAFTRRLDKVVEDIVMAFGAHFDPDIALLRALTELNQFIPAVLPIGADGSGQYGHHDREAIDWWKTATVENQPYLLPDANAPLIARSDFERTWGDDVRDDVIRCRELVAARGLEFLVLDQTRPDIGLPVVKVVVPGMRHFWVRFAPGRLFDVPVARGWLDEPTAEEDLNPIAMFV